MAQVIIPNNLFSPLVFDELNLNDVILNPSMGVTAIGGNSNYMKGGEIFTWRLSENLGTDWADIIDETTEVTAEYLDQLAIKGISLEVGKGWAESEHNKVLIGGDTINPEIARNLAKAVNAGVQSKLVSAIKGAFAAASASDFIVDVSGTGSGILTDNGLVDIKADKYPNKQDMYLQTLIVHSKVYANLKKTWKMEYLNTQSGAEVAQTQGIPNLFGLKVIQSDNLCTPIIADGVTKYPSYLCAPGAFMVDFTRDPKLTSFVNPKKGAITTEWYTYMSFYASFHAASWKGATGAGTPTNVALATGANWEMKYYDKENVKAIQILSILPTE